ncbi:hypothetical protein BGY98DRAFT_936998 [Russula aff. rugulosa BPL654]|nr:hypothetical protein BGY98DRAFT_936998 [Russula aff. rugulosa BPL654]
MPTVCWSGGRPSKSHLILVKVLLISVPLARLDKAAKNERTICAIHADIIPVDKQLSVSKGSEIQRTTIPLTISNTRGVSALFLAFIGQSGQVQTGRLWGTGLDEWVELEGPLSNLYACMHVNCVQESEREALLNGRKYSFGCGAEVGVGVS